MSVETKREENVNWLAITRTSHGDAIAERSVRLAPAIYMCHVRRHRRLCRAREREREREYEERQSARRVIVSRSCGIGGELPARAAHRFTRLGNRRRFSLPCARLTPHDLFHFRLSPGLRRWRNTLPRVICERAVVYLALVFRSLTRVPRTARRGGEDGEASVSGFSPKLPGDTEHLSRRTITSATSSRDLFAFPRPCDRVNTTVPPSFR